MLFVEEKSGDILIDKNGYLEDFEYDGYYMNGDSFFLTEAISLNKDLYKSYDLYRGRVSIDDNIGVFLLGSLVRVHKDFQTVIILECRGLQSQASAIARNMMEKVFYMKAISKNNDYLEDWINRQKKDRNTLKEVVSGGYAYLSEEEISRMDLSKEPVPKGKDIPSISEWATRADLKHDYEVIFRQLCFDIHHSSPALTYDFLANEDGRLSIIDIHPHFDMMEALISLSIEYLLKAIQTLADYIDADCSWTEWYHKWLDEISDEVEDENN